MLANFKEQAENFEIPTIIEPLSPDEVQYARQIISESHPLRSMPLGYVFPAADYTLNLCGWILNKITCGLFDEDPDAEDEEQKPLNEL